MSHTSGPAVKALTTPDRWKSTVERTKFSLPQSPHSFFLSINFSLMQPILSDIRVLEFAGLAPGPFCGLILADFGADVIRVDRCTTGTTDVLSRGKRSIALNLKSKQVINMIKQSIIPKVDVLIDPFRVLIYSNVHIYSLEY
jgi:hypothetical protein